MKKKEKNTFEVIYFEDDQIIIEEDNRKKYPFMLFFFKYGRLITMLFASISILTFIGGIALSISMISRNTPPFDIDQVTSMEFNGMDNKINTTSSEPVTKEYAENTFNSRGKVNNTPYMKVTNIITVGNDKVIYFDNGAAVILYGDRNKLPIYVPNSNNVIIDKKTNTITVHGNTVSTIKKSVLPDGMIVYEFENDKLMTEKDDDYRLYNKNKGIEIDSIKVGNNKVLYFDNGAAVIVYNDDTLPDYIDNMDNVSITNNNINVNGEKIKATDKKTLPDGTTLYNFPNNKSLHENKTTDHNRLYDTDKIIYDKDGNIKEMDANTNSNNTLTPNKETTVDKDKVLYFDNGSAVIIYNDKNKLPEYIPNKNDVNTETIPLTVDGTKIPTIDKKVLPDGTIIYEFDNDKMLIEKDDEYKLIDKDSIEFDEDGNIKEDNDNNSGIVFKDFTIKNNSDEKLKYRIVIEKSKNYGNKKELDLNYLYQKISIDNDEQETTKLNSNPWTTNTTLENGLTIPSDTYILYEGQIDEKSMSKVKLAVWVDYETIPNEMQDKWFIGTVKLYSWQN